MIITNHRLVYKLWSELSDEQKELVQNNLSFIPFDDERETRAELWIKYINDEVKLGYVPDEKGDIKAYVFFQIDDLLSGKRDLVVLSAVKVEGVNTMNLTEQCIPILEEYAKKHDCDSISLKTIHPALSKKLIENCNWHLSEIVMRKSL